MNPQTQQQVMGALGYNMALPQSVVPVTKVQTQVSRTQYDPNKLRAVMDALGVKRATVPQASPYESLAAALGAMEAPKSYTGGFGEVIENPYANAIAAFAKGWGNAYGARKANERAYAQSQIDAQNAAREDAIKAAQIDLEASKQAITNQTSQDYLKVNDPNAKGAQEQAEQMRNLQTVDAMARDLEDIGTRFDNSFKNIDDMQQNSSRWGRMWTDGLWGVGTTTSEKQARDEFKAWKDSMKNVLVNANRQAGSGSMSDADAARYEQNIGDAETPAEARNILRAFEKRMQVGSNTTNPYEPGLADGQSKDIKNDIEALWGQIK